MVLAGHTQHFHSGVLQSQQQFRTVGKQEVHIRAAELHHHFRVFNLRVCGIAFRKHKGKIETSVLNHLTQEWFDTGSKGFDAVLFLAHVAVLLTFDCSSLAELISR